MHVQQPHQMSPRLPTKNTNFDSIALQLQRDLLFLTMLSLGTLAIIPQKILPHTITIIWVSSRNHSNEMIKSTTSDISVLITYKQLKFNHPCSCCSEKICYLRSRDSFNKEFQLIPCYIEPWLSCVHPRSGNNTE
jgi:hypothetical protein